MLGKDWVVCVLWGFHGGGVFDALRLQRVNDWVSELLGTDFGFEKSR
jgi:hypothetical protein